MDNIFHFCALLNNEINVGGGCCTHFFGVVDFCTCYYCLQFTLIDTTLYGNIAGIWSHGNIGGICTKVLFLTLQAVSGVPMWFQKHSLTRGDGGKFSPGYTGIFLSLIHI